MKKIMLATLFLMISSAGFSQYKTAVGIRFNGGYGVSIKHNKNARAAFEGIVSGYRNGINAALLYEIHNASRQSPGFRWYYGAGGHFGAWRDYPYERHPWWYDDTRSGVNLGVDGIVGIEYTFSEIPLNLSLDWKPVFNIVQRPGVFVGDVGLTVRLPFR